MPKVTPTKPRPAAKPAGSIDLSPMEDQSTEDLKCNFYGRTGTGKTTLWGSFPGKILAIICSGKGELKSLDTPELRKKIYPHYLKEPEEIFQLVEQYSGEFATTVLDHATGLQSMVLARILGLDKLPEQSAWGLASQQQYGQCTLQCKELMRKLIDMPGHTVIVAQERAFNVSDRGEVSDVLLPSVGAALSPSLTDWLNSVSDYICQTYIREQTAERTATVGGKPVRTVQKTGKKEYCLRIDTHTTFMTRFRKPKEVKIPEVIPDPSFAKIIQAIKGELKC